MAPSDKESSANSSLLGESREDTGEGIGESASIVSPDSTSESHSNNLRAASMPIASSFGPSWKRNIIGVHKCGRRHQGTTPVAQPPAGGVALLGRGGIPRRGWRPCRAGRNLGARRHRPGVVVSGCSWGGEWVSVATSRMCWPLTHHTPPLSVEVKLGAFRASGVVNPQGRRGGVRPASLGRGGGVHRRDAGGPRPGGPGRPGGPDRARRIAPPLLRASPRERASGGPVRPGGPLRGQHAPRVPPGSSG